MIKKNKDVLEKTLSEDDQGEENLLDAIAELNPEAILLEPQKIYNSAILGYDTEGRVVYSVDCIITSLVEDGMERDEAIDFFEFNTLGTFMGMSNPNKPIFTYEQ